jgi:hypothetical protein
LPAATTVNPPFHREMARPDRSLFPSRQHEEGIQETDSQQSYGIKIVNDC